MLEYGYVKILTTPNKGRIGRYIRNDSETGKAVVSFGYQIDIIPNIDFIKLSKTSLTNNINKKDLIDRYNNIIVELKKIDLRAHRTINKNGPKHIEIINECNLIRNLLKELYSPNLTIDNQKKNILLLSSFKDIEYAYDFSLDLESCNYNIFLYDHELKKEIDYSLYKNILLIVSDNSLNDGWILKDYQNIKEKIDNELTNIISIHIDNSKVPNYLNNNYDLKELFSEEYEENFYKLTRNIEEK